VEVVNLKTHLQNQQVKDNEEQLLKMSMLLLQLGINGEDNTVTFYLKVLKC
jgi:hypothetical protein